MHLIIFVARVYIDLMKLREVAQKWRVHREQYFVPIPSRGPVDISCGRVGLSRLETRGTSGAAVAGDC